MNPNIGGSSSSVININIQLRPPIFNRNQKFGDYNRHIAFIDQVKSNSGKTVKKVIRIPGRLSKERKLSYRTGKELRPLISTGCLTEILNLSKGQVKA